MLAFKNPGLIDLTAATTLGVNVKESTNPIGQFGTGLKCAISIILRLGGSVEIWRGRKLHTFGLKEKTIRGEKFRIVTMNGRELGFVDQYAAHWEPWMAYRELWSNCRDEGGEVMSVASVDDLTVEARSTIVVVRCAELQRAHDERHKIVLQTQALVTLPDVEVHAGVGDYIYYGAGGGIRVAHVPEKRKSLYTYCLTGHQTLTEDRTLAYQWGIPGKIATALVQCTNASVLTDVLTAEKNFFEHHLPWTDVKSQKPSPQFMETAEALRAADRLKGSALNLFKSYLDTIPGYHSPFLARPTMAQEETVREALEMLEGVGVHIERNTLQFKTDSYLGVRTENEMCTVPAENLNDGALPLARALLVWWSRDVGGGHQSLAHRVLTGEWPEGHEIRKSKIGEIRSEVIY